MLIRQALSAVMALGLDRLDAQLLALHVLGHQARDRGWLLAHDCDVLSNSDWTNLEALTQRRAAGEPLAYLTGHREFHGLDLQVNTQVLVPRPDTETLVDWALEILETQPGATVIDLGTGSGAIALALKHARPDLTVSALDASPGALSVARSNAERLQLDIHFLKGSWLDGMTTRFHAIVSNPPYIAAHDRHLDALRHEPIQALVSGDDGLRDLRIIATQARRHLLPAGWLLLEHGYDQATQVRQLLQQAGFEAVQSKSDLSGIQRCTGGRAPLSD